MPRYKLREERQKEGVLCHKSPRRQVIPCNRRRAFHFPQLSSQQALPLGTKPQKAQAPSVQRLGFLTQLASFAA